LAREALMCGANIQKRVGMNIHTECFGFKTFTPNALLFKHSHNISKLIQSAQLKHLTLHRYFNIEN